MQTAKAMQEGEIFVSKRFKRWIGSHTPMLLHILMSFWFKMWYGYRCYAAIKKQNGGAHIFLQYYQGTGDVYLSTAYLKYCEQKKMQHTRLQNSVFVVNGKNAYRIAKLFQLRDIPVVMQEVMQAEGLVYLTRFLGMDKVDIEYLHYISDVPMYTNPLIFLSGLHGIHFMDLYQAVVFQNEEIKLPCPIWNDDVAWVKTYFEEKKLVQGKTVLIAPDANSIAKGPTPEFWKLLAERLKKRGYTVCTNLSTPDRIPIDSTKGVFIPYDKMKSFLEMAGTFVGYRSGLCDLTAGIDCRKIVIYPDSTWPIHGGLGIGSTLEIFSLEKIGLCEDILELVYCERENNQSVEKIMEYVINR